MTPFDNRICQLGEGPLWHPDRQALFWFDIHRHRMLCRAGAQTAEWQFDEPFSAAGLVDHDTLILASATALWRFDIATGQSDRICGLEADNAVTRSNDGRADPWGGFWIGTMGRQAEIGAGAIWRYHRGTLRRLVAGVTISNALCFAPDRSCAYYTDTAVGMILRQPLEAQTGWPDGAPQAFADLGADGLNPDGAVTDRAGNLWIALWGDGRVICLDAEGRQLRSIALSARQPTCPAFGGPDLCDLHVTSAAVGLAPVAAVAAPQDGMTFRFSGLALGQPEPRVLL